MDNHNLPNPALTLLREYYERIISHMPGHVYWKNKKGIFLGCNKTQATDAGLDAPEKIRGKTDFDMPWSDQAQYLRDIDQRVMSSAEPHTIEENFELPDGTKKLYLSKKVPLFNEKGEVDGILGISFDITEKREAAERLEEAKAQAELANQAKTEFIKNMSHDIRTPLAGMIALSESIYLKAQTPQDREDAHDLYKAAKQLLKLLNEVLEMASFDMNHVQNEYKPFNPSQMMLSIQDLMKPFADKKELGLHFDVDQSLDTLCESQPILLHRILLNLIGNAIKFTDTGQVSLIAKTQYQSEKNITMTCIITDTGIGMSQDIIENIFQPFHKASPSYEGKYQGLGLGLYIAKQFIDRLGGNIQVHSKENQGSQFTITLTLQRAKGERIATTDYGPIDLAYQPEEITQINIAPESNQDIKAHILLVEDTPIAQKAAALKLNSIGTKVDIASTGKQALKMAKAHRYDLIYMDIGLPDINGYIITEALREYECEHTIPPTPIVALTAHVDEDGEKKCYDAGMNFVIHKPLLSDYAQRLLEKFVLRNKNTTTTHTTKKAGSVIDWNVAIKTLGSLETAKEMFQLFLQDLPKIKAQLISHYENQQWQQLNDITHQLNGSASYAPTPRLKQAAVNLEKALNKNDENKKPCYLTLIDEINFVLDTQLHH